jgi:hypothetical protein
LYETSSAPPQSRSLWPVAALLAILAVGAGLRFYGLFWGFPLHLHCDENKLLGVAQRLGESIVSEHSLNPHFSAYGALPMYLVLIGGGIVRGLGALAGYHYQQEEALLIAGRILSALADLCSVYLLYLIGRRRSELVGLGAAALYSVALVAVRESHFFSPDSLATTLVLLYVLTVTDLPARPGIRNFALAGATLGLALSVKFSAIPLVVLGVIAFLAVAHGAARRGGDPRPFRMAAAARRTRIGVGVLTVLSLLPVLVWQLNFKRIEAFAAHALDAQVDDVRIASHDPEFWSAQIHSTVSGLRNLLLAGAVVSVLGGAAVLTWMSYDRGPRTYHEVYNRLPLLGAFVFSAPAVFLLLNPYAILDFFHYWAPAGPDHLTWNLLMVTGAFQPPPGWMLQFIGTYPFVYQFVHVYPYALGIPLTLVLAAGLVWGIRALIRRDAPDLWATVVSSGLLVLLMARMAMKMTRYALPMVPLLCPLAAGLGFGGAAESRRARTVAFVAGGFVYLWSLAWCIGYLNVYAKPDNRAGAIAWVRGNVGPGQHLVYEKDDTWGAAGEWALRNSGAYSVERLEPFSVSQDLVGKPLSEEDMDAKRRYLAAVLGRADWLVVTDTTRNRLRRLRSQFPVITEFYDRLLSGQTQFEQVAIFSNGATFLGRPVDDSLAEPSFRLFDHPEVRIFRRKPATAH